MIKDTLVNIAEELLRQRQFGMAKDVIDGLALIDKLERTAAKLEHKRRVNVHSVKVLTKKVRQAKKGLRTLSNRLYPPKPKKKTFDEVDVVIKEAIGTLNFKEWDKLKIRNFTESQDLSSQMSIVQVEAE